jgi:hypothetical protein
MCACLTCRSRSSHSRSLPCRQIEIRQRSRPKSTIWAAGPVTAQSLALPPAELERPPTRRICWQTNLPHQFDRLCPATAGRLPTQDRTRVVFRRATLVWPHPDSPINHRGASGSLRQNTTGESHFDCRRIVARLLPQFEIGGFRRQEGFMMRPLKNPGSFVMTGPKTGGRWRT